MTYLVYAVTEQSPDPSFWFRTEVEDKAMECGFAIGKPFGLRGPQVKEVRVYSDLHAFPIVIFGAGP